MVKADDAAEPEYICQKCGYVIPSHWSRKDRAMSNREADYVGDYLDPHGWETRFVSEGDGGNVCSIDTKVDR